MVRAETDGDLYIELQGATGDKPGIVIVEVITVVGRAFFDIDHALKDQSNRRKRQPDHAAWEIHPVMKLTVQ